MIRPITKAFLQRSIFLCMRVYPDLFSSSESAEKTKEKTAPATVYWMSVVHTEPDYPGHVR